MKGRIFKNIAWLFFDKILRIFGGLVIGVWVARYLGPKNFGVLNYAMAFAAFFSFASDLGLPSILVRELSLEKRDPFELLGTSLLLKIIGGIVATTFVFISIIVVKRNDRLTMIVTTIISLIYIFKSFDVIEYYFQSMILSKYTVIARNCSFLISSIFKIILIYNKASVIYFALAVLVDIIIGSIFLNLIYNFKQMKFFNWKFSKEIAVYLLKNGWPLMLSTFLITVYVKIDQLMIDRFMDMESVGLYSVAVRLCTSWYFIPSIVISTLMPYFIKIRENNKVLFFLRLKQIHSIMIWLGIFAGVFTILFGKDIIIILFGDEYTQSYNALVLNIWSGIFISIGYAGNLWIISGNLQIYRFIGTSISVVLNIIGNIILIPQMGITGAALATLLTHFIGTCITPLFFKEIRYYAVLSMKSIIPFYLLKGLK